MGKYGMIASENVHRDFHRNKLITIIKRNPLRPIRDIEKRYYKDCKFYKIGRISRAMAKAGAMQVQKAFIAAMK